MAALKPKKSLLRGFGAWWRFHKNALRDSLKRWRKTPVATARTILLIALAFTLPCCLYVVLRNAAVITHAWDRSSTVVLYLKQDVNESQIKYLKEQLFLREGIRQLRVIDPKEGLQELQSFAGFGDVLNQLPENPLPFVIELYPSKAWQDPARLQMLLSYTQRLPEVEHASFDMQWLQRLQAILSVLTRATILLFIFLAFAMVLIVAHTVRTNTQARTREITLARLCGANQAYIRRPFLYSGVGYGLMGGLIALGLSTALLFAIRGPVEHVLTLYSSTYQLRGIPLVECITILLFGSSLGWLGARWAVGRELK